MFKQVLASLHNIVNELEGAGLTKEASIVHNIFTKVAADWDLNELKREHYQGFGDEGSGDRPYADPVYADPSYRKLEDFTQMIQDDPRSQNAPQNLRQNGLEPLPLPDPRLLRDLKSNAESCVVSLGKSFDQRAISALWEHCSNFSRAIAKFDKNPDDPTNQEHLRDEFCNWEETLQNVLEFNPLKTKEHEIIQNALYKSYEVHGRFFGSPPE